MPDHQQIIKQMLSLKRYNHSIAVAQKAKELAQLYGADENKAYTAALLHDICKEMPPQTQLQWIEKSAIILDSAEKSQPNLWHGIAGAAYCKAELAITDPDILAAIQYHTSGRGDMSTLEKIIYLADLTSADRDYPDVAIMRGLVLQCLDKAMWTALQFIVAQLATTGQLICPNTYEAYQWYCARVMEE